MTNPPATVVRGAIMPDRPELGPVDVLVAEERIVRIADAGTIDARVVLDADGAWLLPGFIDAHVHPIHAETLASVGQAAPLGGITTVLDHFYPRAGLRLSDEVDRARDEAAAGAADHGFHVRITPDRLEPSADGRGLADELRLLAGRPGVVSVKAFLAHADPAVMVNGGGLTEVLHAASIAGLPVVVHAEPGEVIEVLSRLSGLPGSLREHDRLRAPDLEAASVALAGAAARALDARLYIAHLSSELAVAAVHHARELGTRVRGESCVHYMTLDSGAPLGSLGRVTPPLRPLSSVAAMRRLAADAESGIDVLASDHCGYAEEEKPLNDFAHAGNGLPGLDSLAPLLVDAVLQDDGWLSAADLVRLACRGPAETFGLAAKGRIEPGADADLVIIDPSGRTRLEADPSGPATAHSPYGDRHLRGALVHVLRRGEQLVANGTATKAGTRGGGRPAERTEPSW